MFEKYIADLLVQHLGAFIQDADKLFAGSSLWNSAFKKENLKLNPNIFDGMDTPLQLIYGKIGKIYIKAPILNMFKSPLIIEIEDVLALTKIKPIERWDVEQHKEQFQQATQKMLEKFERKLRQLELEEEYDKIDKAGQKQKKNSKFRTKITNRILKNIQIKIKNVYLRFDDIMHGTKDQSYAMGILLKEFSVSNEAKSNEENIVKTMVVDGLSIFCDWEKQITDLIHIDYSKLHYDQSKYDAEFYKILERNFSDETSKRVKHKFLLESFGLDAQINFQLVDPSGQNQLKKPQFQAKVVFGKEVKNYLHHHQLIEQKDSIELCLHQPQILRILKSIEILGFYNEFKKGAQAQFFQLNLSKTQVKHYIEQYAQWRLLSKQEKPSAKDKLTLISLRNSMKLIENLVDCSQIIKLREHAIIQITTNSQKAQEILELDDWKQSVIKAKYSLIQSKEQKQEILKGIEKEFSAKQSMLESQYRLKNGIIQREQQELALSLNKQMSSQLFSPTKFQRQRSPEKPHEQEVKGGEQGLKKKEQEEKDCPESQENTIDVSIPSIKFSMLNEYDQKLFELQVHKIKLNQIEHDKKMKAIVNLQDFKVTDLWTQSPYWNRPLDTIFEKRVIHKDPSKIQQAVHIEYEKNKNIQTPEKIVFQVNKPLYITVNPVLLGEVERTMKMAVYDQKLDFKFYKQKASQEVEEIRQMLKEQAEQSVLVNKGDKKHKHKSISIDASIKAPIIFIPQDIYDADTKILKLSGGTVSVQSKLVPFDKDLNYNEVFDEDKLFDTYTLQIKNVSLSLIDAKEKSFLKESFVLEKIGLKVCVGNCLLHNHDCFPAIKTNIDFENELVFNADLQHFKVMEQIVVTAETQLKYQVAAIIQEQLDQSKTELELAQEQIMQKLQSRISEQMRFYKRVKEMRRMTKKLIDQSKLKDCLQSQRISPQKLITERQEESESFESIQDSQSVFSMDIQDSIRDTKINIGKSFVKSMQQYQPEKNQTDVEVTLKMNRMKINLGYNKEAEKVEEPDGQKGTFDKNRKNLIKSTNFSMKKPSSFTRQPDDQDMIMNFLTLEKQDNNFVRGQTSASKLSKENSKTMRMDGMGNMLSSATKTARIPQSLLSNQTIKKKQTFDERKARKQESMANSLEIVYEGVEEFIQIDKKSKKMQLKGSVHKVTIRDNESYRSDNFKLSNDPRLDIFKRFFSSPINDQDYLNQEGSQKQECVEKQAYFALEVQKNKVTDETTGEEIDQESIEATCLMNRARVVMNIPTCTKIIFLLSNFMEFDKNQKMVVKQIVLKHKQNVIDAVKSQSENLSQYEQLTKTIIQNLAVQNRVNTEDQFHEFYTRCNEILSEDLKFFIEQNRIEQEPEDQQPNHPNEDREEPDTGSRVRRLSLKIKSNFQKLAPEEAKDELKEKLSKNQFVYIHKMKSKRNIRNINMTAKNLQIWFLDFDESNPNSEAKIIQMSYRQNAVQEILKDQMSLDCSSEQPKNEQRNQSDECQQIDSFVKQNSIMKSLHSQITKTTTCNKIEDAEEGEEQVIKFMTKEKRLLRREVYEYVNVSDFQVQHLYIDKWTDVQEAAVYTQFNANQFETHSDQSRLQTETREFSDVSFDDSESPEKKQFLSSMILVPTNISVTMSVTKHNQQQLKYKDDEADFEPLYFQLDYKDINLIYYFLKRIEQCLHKYEGPEIDIDALSEKFKSESDLDSSSEGRMPTTERSEEPKIAKSLHHQHTVLENQQAHKEPEKKIKKQKPTKKKDMVFHHEVLEVGQKIAKYPQSDFQVEVVNKSLRLSSLIVSFNDGDQQNLVMQQPGSSVFDFVISDFSAEIQKQVDFSIQKDKQFTAVPVDDYLDSTMEEKASERPYKQTVVSLSVYSNYFNEISQGFEPLIEPYSIQFRQKQMCEKQENVVQVINDNFLNLNFTYGMALSWKKISSKIKANLDNIDEIFNAPVIPYYIKKAQEKPSEDEYSFEDSDEEPVQKSNKLVKRLTGLKSSNKNIVSGSQSHSKQSGFLFYNFTGMNLKFCDSNINVNDMMVRLEEEDCIKDNTPVVDVYEDHIRFLPGTYSNHGDIKPQFLRQKFFTRQKCSKQVKKVDKSIHADQIEDDPLTIDVKIDGIDKITGIPLDIVGVFSYPTFAACGHQGKEIQQPVNVIVNVNAVDKKHNISIESQLILANNQQHPITLIFYLNKINKHSCRKIQKFKLATQRIPQVKLGHHSVQEIISGDATKKINTKQSDSTNFLQAKTKSLLNKPQQIIIPNNMQTSLEVENRKTPTSLKTQAVGKFKANLGNDSPNYINSVDAVNQDEVVNEKPQVKLTLDPDEIFNVPIAWLMDDSEVDIYIVQKRLCENDGVTKHKDDFTKGFLPVFKNISKIFTKTAKDKNREDFCDDIKSQTIELNEDFYTTVDIQGYSCLPKISQDRNPLQYIVSFNPPLMLTNYVMNTLEIYEINASSTTNAGQTFDRPFIHRITPSKSANIIELDLSKQSKAQIKFEFTDRSSGMKYFTIIDQDNSFDIQHDQELNQYNRESSISNYKFYRYREQDLQMHSFKNQNLSMCKMQIETVQKIYSELKSYNQNFEYRERLINISIAVKMMIYPKHMIVNKSCHDIYYLDNQMCQSKSNDYLMSDKDHKSFQFYAKIEGTHQFYQKSEAININKVGQTRELTMDNPDSLGQLQFGVSIHHSSYPFNKTIIITIVPKYLLVNKLQRSIRIRQKCFRKEDFSNKKDKSSFQVVNDTSFSTSREGLCRPNKKHGCHVTLSCDECDNQQELHLQRLDLNKPDKCTQIQFKLLDPEFDDASIQHITMSDNEDLDLTTSRHQQHPEKGDDPIWCKPFSVEDIDSFLTQSKTICREENENLMIQERNIAEDLADQPVIEEQWFVAQARNNFNQITRVIVTKNPRDKNASNLIIFKEPTIKEFTFKNDTNLQVEYQKCECRDQDQKQKNLRKFVELSESQVIEAKTSEPFVWDSREVTNKQILIKLIFCELGHPMIQLTQRSLQQDSINCAECGQLISRCIGFKKIYECQTCAKQFCLKCFDKMNKITIEDHVSIDQVSRLNEMNEPVESFFKEFGPYTFNTKVHYDQNLSKVLTIIQHLTADLIGTEQFDKCQMQEMKSTVNIAEPSSILCKPKGQSLQEKQVKHKLEQLMKQAFFKKEFTKSTKIEIKLAGFGLTLIDNQPKELMFVSIKDVRVNAQINEENATESALIGGRYEKSEIDFQIGHAQIDNMVNDNLPVILGTKEFYQSNIRVQNAATDHSRGDLAEFYKTVKDTDVVKSHYSAEKRRRMRQEIEQTSRVPFMIIQVRKSRKRFENITQSIVRYENLTFKMKEFFLQIDSNIINDNMKFFITSLSLFSFEKNMDQMNDDGQLAMDKKRHEFCSSLDASQGVTFSQKLLATDLFSFGFIRIGIIDFDLTVNFDKPLNVSELNPSSGSSLQLFSTLYPYLSNLAQITDAHLWFNELIIIEGSYSQKQLQRNIKQHYKNQALVQLFKLVGGTDFIGDPVGLFTKVGKGFVTLAKDPFQGAKEEGKKGFIRGLGTGSQAAVSSFFGGTSRALAKISGSFYVISKKAAGGYDLRKVKPKNIKEGTIGCFQGMGQETYLALSGFFVHPKRGYRLANKQNKCVGCSKGLCQGVAGVICCPFACFLRGSEQFFVGIEGSSINLQNLGKTKLQLLNTQNVRVRLPRRIDIHGQIRIYNEDLAIINMLLSHPINPQFHNQLLKFYAILPIIDDHGHQTAQKNLLVITNDYLIYMRVFNFFSYQKQKYYYKSVLMSEKLNNITHYGIWKSQGFMEKNHDARNSKINEKLNQELQYHDSLYFLDIVFRKHPQSRTQNLSEPSINQLKLSLKKPNTQKELEMAPLPRGLRTSFHNPEQELKFDHSKIGYSKDEQSDFYRYIFYSQNLETLLRIHTLFQSFVTAHSK